VKRKGKKMMRVTRQMTLKRKEEKLRMKKKGSYRKDEREKKKRKNKMKKSEKSLLCLFHLK